MGKLRETLDKLQLLFKPKNSYQYHRPQYFAVVNGTKPSGKKILLESHHDANWDYDFILKRPSGKGNGQELIHEAYAQGWRPETTTHMLKAIHLAVKGIHHDQLVVMYMELLGKQFNGIVQAIEYLEPFYYANAHDYLEELATIEEDDIRTAELDKKVNDWLNSDGILEHVKRQQELHDLDSVQVGELFAEIEKKFRDKQDLIQRGLRIVD